MGLSGDAGSEDPRRAALELWAKVVANLPGGDGSAVLRAVEPGVHDGGVLRLCVPSHFHRDRLSHHGLAIVEEVVAALSPGTVVEVAVEERVAHPSEEPVGPVPSGWGRGGGPPGGGAPPTGNPDGLDPRLSFEAFVVGQTNRLAHAAALSVAENANPRLYNPLFIHGESGNGKTHLLHAIGLYVRANTPGQVVRYVTSERFTSEFIRSIAVGSHRSGFTQRYRACSFLLVDDLQFLEGKVETQKEFFHTFDEVTAAGGRVVLSADRHPGDIPTLPERLRSRFTSGLVADLEAPEFETRVAILDKKAEATGVDVAYEVLLEIAAAVTRNVRELEGALTRVVADARLDGRRVTLNEAKASLARFLGCARQPLTLRRIIDEASDVFGFSVEELCGSGRTRALVLARQAAMYVCRALTEESLPAIGRAFGGRDHTTVMHAVRKIEQQMSERKPVYAKVVELMNRLGGRPDDGPRPAKRPRPG